MAQRLVVLTAAGAGLRLGRGGPKALVPIAGKPLVAWAMENLRDVAGIGGTVVTAPADHLDQFRAALEPVGFPYTVIAGGATRQQSVRRGLAELRQRYSDFDSATVLVHDAARCLTPAEVFERVAQAVESTCDAVSPALPVIDTICEVAGPPTETGQDWIVSPTLLQDLKSHSPGTLLLILDFAGHVLSQK